MNSDAQTIRQVSDFGAGMAIAIYLAMVLYQGNIEQLGKEAIKDYGYLEWLIAAVLLKTIYDVTDNKVVAWLIITGVIAGMVLFAQKNSSFATNLKAFGTGQKTLFATIADFFRSSGSALTASLPLSSSIVG